MVIILKRKFEVIESVVNKMTKITLLLFICYINSIETLQNYTTKTGNVIVGHCDMLPLFLGQPQPLCRTEGWYDSAIVLMEYNQALSLTCNLYAKRQKLEEFTFPHFAKPMSNLSMVTVGDCPTANNYNEVFKKMNVVNVTDLHMNTLPLNPTLKASAFDGLKLQVVAIQYNERVIARPSISDDMHQYIATVSEVRLKGLLLPPLPGNSTIETLNLESGTSRRSLGGCSHLRKLILNSWDVESLQTEDEGWISSCHNLTDFEIETPSIDTLYRVLTKATSLRKLEIYNLPERMFDIDVGITKAIYIESIKITKSQLYQFHIKDTIFAKLSELDLSKNAFGTTPTSSLEEAFVRAPYLKTLTLAGNSPLDFCRAINETNKRHFTAWFPNLETLDLSRTAQSGLCLQNFHTQSLTLLDLSYCNIKNVEFSGLPKFNNTELELRLNNNDIEEISFHENDYNIIVQNGSPTKPREMGIKKLYLQENRIQNFTAHSLPDTLKVIDLSHNVISYIDERTASALFSVPDRRMKFTGNTIVCDCKNQAFLAALIGHSEQVDDFAELSCTTDGQLISNITVSALCPILEQEHILVRVFLPILLISSSIIALATALYFRYGQEIKIFLYARGLCLCCLKEERIDVNRPFDVFISFSHDDEEYVLNELLPLLERDEYKTCVHMRDWIIGEWIPKQISVSIDISRRTLIVLSKSFVKSVWGMLEFRMAHASMLSEGRARMIVVVVDDIAKTEDLDPELKGYLRTNTYLETSDPWFWDKLRFALPRRGRVAKHRTKDAPPPDASWDFGPYGNVTSLVQMPGHRDNPV